MKFGAGGQNELVLSGGGVGVEGAEMGSGGAHVKGSRGGGSLKRLVLNLLLERGGGDLLWTSLDGKGRHRSFRYFLSSSGGGTER